MASKNSSHIQTQCLVKRAFKLRNGCVENECFINASVYAPNFKSGFDGTMKISLNSLFKYLLLYTFYPVSSGHQLLSDYSVTSKTLALFLPNGLMSCWLSVVF